MKITVVIAATVFAIGTALPSTANAQGSAAPPGLRDNLTLFVGPEGSKQPQDLGVNANMGIRFAANLGLPLSERLKVGIQIGVASNLSDAAVHVLDQLNGPSRRTQTFLTVGVFQRPTATLHYGLVYDLQFERYYDDFTFGQWRGDVGYGITDDNEIGVWFTRAAHGADGAFVTTPLRLDPISQVNAYTRHTWASAAQTSVWLGVANGHDTIVLPFPNAPRDEHVLVYGAELVMPLSERFAVTGSANLITPTATGTVDAFLGVTYYPRRGALRAARNRFAPPLAVANNPTMAINARR